MNILIRIKNILICYSENQYISKFNRDEILNIISSKQFPALRLIRLDRNGFEIYIKSDTSIVPPCIQSIMSDSKYGTSVDVMFVQNSHLKKIFYPLYIFILILGIITGGVLFFEIDIINKENLDSFLSTFIFLVVISIIIPQALFFYEKHKAIRVLRNFIKIE